MPTKYESYVNKIQWKYCITYFSNIRLKGRKYFQICTLYGHANHKQILFVIIHWKKYISQFSQMGTISK